MKRRVLSSLALLAAVLSALVFWPEPPIGPTGGWLAAAGLVPRTETVEGLRIRYVRAGQGPPIVLLHGLASSIYTWKDVFPQLAGEHDVIALDLPGFGASDIPPVTDGELYPKAVGGLLDRLGVARASLVGNSLGGAVSIALAARDPGRVDRLVLLDSAGFNFAARDRPALLRVVGALPPGLLEALPFRRRLVALGLRQVFHDDRLVDAERVREYAAPLGRPGAAAAVHGLMTLRDPMGFPGVVSGVRAPTLVIWGREDAWIPVEHAQRFAAALPGARVVVLEGCGHMPQEERPVEVAALLKAFLRS